MNIRRAVRGLFLVCALPRLCGAVDTPNSNLAANPSEVQFNQTAPYSTPIEIERRFGFRQTAPEYDVTREKFQIIAPETYDTNADWGLLVWVSPGDDARLRPDWGSELAKHRLLFVGACNSGNNRNPIDRFRLALDATCNMSRRLKLDSRRIYAGGFSGGARIASMLGVGYADIFSGALCVCGVNFYRNVPAEGGDYYPATYRPNQNLVARAKQNGRFVLLTGEQDMNRASMKSHWENGFKPNGFQKVLYLDVKGMKHELPGAPVLNTALNFLDGVAAAPTAAAR